jgi:hypothetical protein
MNWAGVVHFKQVCPIYPQYISSQITLADKLTSGFYYIDTHYRQLGADIKSLAENLEHIQNIVQNASLSWQQQALRSRQLRGTSSQKEWELSSVQEIVGDYKATLAGCQKLLDENSEFLASRGAIYNVEWNLVIRPKVDYLQKRLRAHNSKLLLLLKPLELSLLSDVYRGLSNIHSDLVERIDAVHQSVLLLQGLLIPDIAQALSEQRQQMEIPLQVPDSIERKFLAATEKSRPEVRQPNRFPLQLGADSFLTHFENSTLSFEAGRFLADRTPQPDQYLNLLKCIWVLGRIRKSDEFAEVSQPSQDSQWPGYINQLHEDLYKECQRFSAPSAQRLFAPDVEIPFEESKYDIWIEENLTSFLSPHIERLLPPVLKIPLPNPSETLKRQLTVHPVNQTRYKLIESIQDISSPAKQTPSLEVNLDLEKFSFIPLYATPSSRPKALEVILDGGTHQVTPEFQDVKHIYYLQHLLTGYKVYDRYDQSLVKVSSVISGQEETIEEYGRLQLWVPHPFTSISPPVSAAELELTAMHGNAQMSSQLTGRGPSRESSRSALFKSSHPQLAVTKTGTMSNDSQLPGSSSALPKIPSLIRKPVPLPTNPAASLGSITPLTHRPVPFPTNAANGTSHPSSTALRSPTLSGTRSVTSASTTASYMSRSTVTTVTTIPTGASSTARLHTKPSKPMLVIFLKSKDLSAKRSIVAIQIDDATSVERERCDCRSSNSQCRISCLERADGYLLAQRWDALNGLNSWNLAKLGMEQRKESEDRWEKVTRVSLKFGSWQGDLLISII